MYSVERNIPGETSRPSFKVSSPPAPSERRNRSNAASTTGMGGTVATSSGSAGGAGVQAAAPSQTFGARQTTLNINLPGSGIFSGDRASLEAFARQLGPVITDLQRKGAL